MTESHSFQSAFRKDDDRQEIQTETPGGIMKKRKRKNPVERRFA
jgi:hypothetical protein